MSLTRHQAASRAFAREPLLQLPGGTQLDIAEGYVPLLVAFTHEDKAAKGLRKGRTAQDQNDAVYFTALEAVRDNQILLLTGPSGSGKTTFAKYLCQYVVVAENHDDQEDAGPIYRNEQGLVLQEDWNELATGKAVACYFDMSNLINEADQTSSIRDNLTKLIQEAKESSLTVVLVMDNAEVLARHDSQLLTSLLDVVEQSGTGTRLVLLANTEACGSWKTPACVARLSLLPLLAVQRGDTVSRWLRQNERPKNSTCLVGTQSAASNPALFALALQSQNTGNSAENIVDTWISAHVEPKEAIESLGRQELERIVCSQATDLPRTTLPMNTALSTHVVRSIIAGRYAAQLSASDILRLYQTAPATTGTLIRSVLARLGETQRQDVISAFLDSTSSQAQRGALLVSDFVEHTDVKILDRLRAHMLEVIGRGQLTIDERVQAGKVISRFGDTRDLLSLVDVPEGEFTFGSETHENSRPVSKIWLPKFKIGRFPVVSGSYLQFIGETGRDWHSPDKNDKERQNVPATDLTWHDARAYCTWLTVLWRNEGKITTDEEVRLPTEPEWERAARGDLGGRQAFTRGNAATVANDERQIYPWGNDWNSDASNNDETGLNSICCVGLFPKGQSPYGCHDMTGQAWEWCSTLWGNNMATPQYKYPYTIDDEREDMDAPDAVRRVLRGGCFSSGRTKATCTYRGSLEASGFWRGNGFRIVVAPVKADL